MCHEVEKKPSSIEKMRSCADWDALKAMWVESYEWWKQKDQAILGQLRAVKGALEKVTLSLLQQQIYGMFSSQDLMEDNENLDAILEDVAEMMLA